MVLGGFTSFPEKKKSQICNRRTPTETPSYKPGHGTHQISTEILPTDTGVNSQYLKCETKTALLKRFLLTKVQEEVHVT